ncbi:hypothetical protein [Rubritalea profundi]|uniref:SLA1 homology domain-containing protein n=1 Tax=Rubritalea profundi TaxID=1658618 RepID=A0A2S7TZ32_9BACT|nr:hypothetical protein [Rubritalea profundi]PQJ28015.1 hypothetical protein BSZ32_05540 [Rubritalea profundi]
MKTTKLLATLLILAAATTSAFSQSSGLSSDGFNSAGINVKPADKVKTTKKTVKTIQFVVVSPERVWKSSDQKKITGSLLAFAIEKKTGKVSIVEAEKIRLLIGKKDFTLPLTSLSLEDQAYIKKLVDSARSAGRLIEPVANKRGTPAGEKPTQN